MAVFSTRLESDRAPRIAVIGGGISGLAAAHHVLELCPQAELEIFEASPRLGGVLDTFGRDGYLVERSADNFLTSRPAGIALCRRLGLDGQLLSTDAARRRAFVVRNGRLLPIPSGFYLMSPRRLGPIIASPVLSLTGKLRLLAEPLVPPRGRLSAEGSIDHESRRLMGAAAISPVTSDESVESFARRRLGRNAFERLVQPLVAGIYTADPSRLSMAATMPQFLDYERQYGSLLRATLWKGDATETGEPDQASGARYGLFVAPKEGMESLVTALANILPASAIHLGAPVSTADQQGDGRWQLSCDSYPHVRPVDGLIVALPAHAAARVLASHSPQLAAELAAIEYAGCVVASCAYRRDQIGHSLDGFGLVVPRVEKRQIVAASFASNKFVGRAPAGGVLIRAVVGGSLQPELVDLHDDALRRLVIDELAELLVITGLPQWIDLARWPNSMPQYHVGHLDRVARIEKLAARWPTLALAGNAYRGVGVPQCIASGEAAAERVLEKARRTDH
jgi:protoporphyrinogen/coproporphyrinogen III oxidase